MVNEQVCSFIGGLLQGDHEQGENKERRTKQATVKELRCEGLRAQTRSWEWER